MRCPDCNKFVSYGDIEPEVNDEQIEGTTVMIEVRVPLPCYECGTELKEMTFNMEAEIEHTCAEDIALENAELEEPEFEITETSATGHDRRQTHDDRGKPIKNPRYQKQYYGAEISVAYRCLRCGEDMDMTEVHEEQASGFDEC